MFSGISLHGRPLRRALWVLWVLLQLHQHYIPASSVVQPKNGLDISNIQEGKAQTLSDIAELQKIEKEYFSNLEKGLAQESITPEEKNVLIEKINQILK